MVKRLTASYLVLAALAIFCVPAGWAAERQTIVVVGDSLSSGYGISAGESWVALLTRALEAQGYGSEVVNASIAGDSSAGGLSRLPRLLATRSPGIGVFQLGGNNGLRRQ